MTEMTRDDLLAQCACFDLRKATRAVSRLYDDCLRPLDLNVTQYSLLRMIETAQQISVSTLGHGSNQYHARARATGAGWTHPLSCGQRQANADRLLTKKGANLIANARPRWDNAQKILLKLIGDRRWIVMRSVLRDATRLVRHARA